MMLDMEGFYKDGRLNFELLEQTILDVLESRLDGRRGCAELLAWLEGSDYFTAPASTRFHNAFQGGLALHSFTVFRLLTQRVEGGWEVGDDTVAVLGLLHDVCKVDFYRRVRKPRNGWTGNGDVPGWEVKDSLPLGHGEKSALILARLMDLTDAEVAAIRWHMLGWDPGVHFNYPSGYPFQAAIGRYPEIVMLAICDWEASFLVEDRGGDSVE